MGNTKKYTKSNNTQKTWHAVLPDLCDADAQNYSCTSTKDRSNGWQPFPPVCLRQFLRKKSVTGVRISNCMATAVFHMAWRCTRMQDNVRYTNRRPRFGWHHILPPDRYMYNIKKSGGKVSRESSGHRAQRACRTTASPRISNAETQMLHFIAFERLKHIRTRTWDVEGRRTPRDDKLYSQHRMKWARVTIYKNKM